MSTAELSTQARTIFSAARLEILRSGLRGPASLEGEDGYDQARIVWNAMIERYPSVVVRCAGAADVMGAVRLAVEHDLPISVRGGGHNIAGSAVCDGGVMLDLARMNTVRVVPAARRATVGPGVTLADVDKETRAFGLALPTGINSTTGIAGLTLGGGFGWLTRAFGMTIDNLLAVDLVTAKGEFVRASDSENPDLFWAVRGGGGNFGIVTSFEFRLHPLEPEILAGLIVHPFDRAEEVLRGYRRIVAEAPDRLTVWTVMRQAPPLPFLPAEWHGREILVLAVCYAGPPAEGEPVVTPLRKLGQPIADIVGPMPFTAWQTAFDPLLTPGARNYWKTHDFTDLPDGAIQVLTHAVKGLPGPECEVFIAQVGGAMARVAPDATAYPYRNAHFIMNVHARWRERAGDESHIAWARSLFRETAPFATGGAYVNFMTEEETDRIADVYGPNYRRLGELKRKWDPDNRLRSNQNISPT